MGSTGLAEEALLCLTAAAAAKATATTGTATAAATAAAGATISIYWCTEATTVTNNMMRLMISATSFCSWQPP